MTESTATRLSLEDRWKRLDLQTPQIPIDTSQQDSTLLQVLEKDEEASTFLNLVKKHPNLLEVLQNSQDGEHTVFVPVNSGWNNTNPQDLDENTLAAHFSVHYLTTETFTQMPIIAMMQRSSPGNRRPVQKFHCGAFGYSIDGTKILKANVKASNGIIHFIQRPCTLPPDTQTVIKNMQDMTYFVKGLKLANRKLLTIDEEQSVLVPADQAFRDLGQDVLQFLFETQEGQPYLTALLSYHIAYHTTVYTNLIWPQNDTAQRLTSKDEVKKLKGNITRPWPSALSNKDGSPVVADLNINRVYGLVDLAINNSANVIDQNKRALNGSVQIIDKVLVPGLSERVSSVDQLKRALDTYI